MEDCYAVYCVISAMDIAVLVASKIELRRMFFFFFKWPSERYCLHPRLTILAMTVWRPSAEVLG